MSEYEHATFGGGCFWCTEAVFKRIRGVEKVTSGYAGGSMPEPSYEQVSSGSTGHAEAIDVEFDPNIISYDELLDVFFGTHDPTQVNRQGGDVGEQYRSVIFAHSPEQQETAEAKKAVLDVEGVFDKPIATAIEPFDAFYSAEEYHQDFYAKNPKQPYCQAVIDPKIAKLRKRFAHLLQKGA